MVVSRLKVCGEAGKGPTDDIITSAPRPKAIMRLKAGVQGLATDSKNQAERVERREEG